MIMMGLLSVFLILMAMKEKIQNAKIKDRDYTLREFVYFDDNQYLHIILEVPAAGADGATKAVDCVVEY